jgi:threonine dehydratase
MGVTEFESLKFQGVLPLSLQLRLLSLQVKPAVAAVIGGPTPVVKLNNLSTRSGRPCYGKFDYRQPSGAFKGRGAAAAVSRMIASRQLNGLSLPTFCTASAGNHGSGLAAAAKHHSASARIFVPLGAPTTKIELIRSFGAEIVEYGSRFDETLAEAQSRCNGDDTVFIHPFDNVNVAAGQGTISLELIDQLTSETLEDATFFLQVGGGGLLAGNAAVLKAKFPRCKIIAVVDEGVPALGLGLICGKPIPSLPITDADGTRVGRVGKTILALRHLIDGVCVVTPQQLAYAVNRFKIAFAENIEGAGALGLAGMHLVVREKLPGAFNTDSSAAICIISGKNVDEAKHAAIVERSQAPEQYSRQAFELTFPERSGMLRELLEAAQGSNIIALHYQQEPGSVNARVAIEFELSRENEVSSLIELFASKGIRASPARRHHHQLQQVVSSTPGELSPQLIPIDNHPGAFLDFVRQLSPNQDVTFLRYRVGVGQTQPGQVWMISKELV